jgi:hypothetical protein
MLAGCDHGNLLAGSLVGTRIAGEGRSGTTLAVASTK